MGFLLSFLVVCAGAFAGDEARVERVYGTDFAFTQRSVDTGHIVVEEYLPEFDRRRHILISFKKSGHASLWVDGISWDVGQRSWLDLSVAVNQRELRVQKKGVHVLLEVGEEGVQSILRAMDLPKYRHGSRFVAQSCVHALFALLRSAGFKLPSWTIPVRGSRLFESFFVSSLQFHGSKVPFELYSSHEGVSLSTLGAAALDRERKVTRTFRNMTWTAKVASVYTFGRAVCAQALLDLFARRS